MFTLRARTPADLGVALQQARLISGLSQRELAAQIGSSQRYLWELESGKEVPAILRLLAALDAVGAEIVINVPEGDEPDG